MLMTLNFFCPFNIIDLNYSAAFFLEASLNRLAIKYWALPHFLYFKQIRLECSNFFLIIIWQIYNFPINMLGPHWSIAYYS